MTPKVKKAAAPKPRKDVSPTAARFAAAVAVEERAHKDASRGDQLSRLAHFEALLELAAAHKECEAVEAERVAAEEGGAAEPAA